MAEELFNNNQCYKYLLTYKCSQDHLEIFFSKIRQRFGNNNNPNVMELKTALKKMLLKNSISSSYAANCIAFDNTTSESIFEIRWRKKSSDLLNMNVDEECIPDIPLVEGQEFDVAKDNILFYICGFIVRKLFKKIDCSTCTENLIENFSMHNYNHKFKCSILVDLKNRGGLIKSSVAVIKIVRFVEHKLIELTNSFTSNTSSITSKIIILTKNYVFNYNIFKNMNCFEESFLDNHKLDLVTIICKKYLKIRLHYVAKIKNSTVVSKRRLLTKLILFNNQ